MGDPARKLPRVLFVDDEPQILAAFSRSLRKHFDVATATSGHAGLRVLADSGPFLVIVSDFGMSMMNGVQFLAQARQIAPGAVRILLTGYSEFEHTVRLTNDGSIFRVLTKPCSAADLIDAVEAGVETMRAASL
jgi:DNA-binding NtrC family response regulator